jgi:hypothetical protein
MVPIGTGPFACTMLGIDPASPVAQISNMAVLAAHPLRNMKKPFLESQSHPPIFRVNP